MTSKKIFFAIIIGIALTIVLASLAFYYVEQRLTNRATNLSKLKADIDAIDVRIKEAQSALLQYEDLKFIDDVAADVLPPNKVQSNLVEELYTLSNKANVTIRSISFESPGGAQVKDPSLSQTKPLEGVGGVFTLPASLTYEASTYDRVLKFLTNLEENRRKLQVSRLNITPVKENLPGGGNAERIVGYQGQIELNVYVRP